MKTLKKIVITKSQFNVIDNSETKINKLIIKDLDRENDHFLLEKKDYILKNGFLDYWFYIIRDFESSLNNEEKNKIIKAISSNNIYSLDYAIHKNSRFPEGEKSISTDGQCANHYAIEVVKKRWTELPGIDSGISKTAEYNIAKEQETALFYAIKILKKPWRDVEGMDSDTIELAEKSLLNMQSGTEFTIMYAIHVMKKRWPKLEEKIINAEYDFNGLNLYIKYIENFIGKRLPRFEETLLNFKDLQLIILYTEKIIKDRWPEAEKEILKQKEIIEHEDEEEVGDLLILPPYYYNDLQTTENRINAAYSEYAKKIIMGPWPDPELD